MEYSEKFFENTNCKYFPCHKKDGDFNCLFCSCPMYFLDKCLGAPEFKEKNGVKIKVCTNCNFPHKAENYDKIMDLLTNHIMNGTK